MVQVILGKVVSRPAKLCQSLARSIAGCGDKEDDVFQTVLGKTISTDDFYEGQGRLDGAICEYSDGDKMEFLQMVQSVLLQYTEQPWNIASGHGKGCRQYGDGGSGVCRDDPLGWHQVCRGLRHPSRQAQRRPGICPGAQSYVLL